MPTSLKEQNRPLLWIIIIANVFFLCGAIQANAITLAGLGSIFSEPTKLAPAGFTAVISTLLNGVLSADVKARLVFLRWRGALPGHRAFSKYAQTDPRIDPHVLEKKIGSSLPADPLEQNRLWYTLYKSVEKDPAVAQVHRDFLLLRDYTALSAIFIIFNGTVALYAISSLRVLATYLLMLFAQYAVVRQSASQYGIRMVTTVLARLPAQGVKHSPVRPKKGQSGRE